jgi:5-methyltetrahydrofolate--homocysteine methyltransferase
MLKGAGFKVIDLGIDTRVEKFIDTIKKENADIVGMSARMRMRGMRRKRWRRQRRC